LVRLSAAWPDLFEALATAFDFYEDAIDARGSNIGHRFIVPSREERVDGVLQFFDTAKGPTPDGLLFEFGKPMLDEIEPVGTGRNEVKHEARALSRPSANPRVPWVAWFSKIKCKLLGGGNLAIEPT
jgi:hypothetical protein